MPNEIERVLSKSKMTGDDVKSVIALVDRESANAVYRQCAEEFNFDITEIKNNAYSIAKELAPVFGYSTKDEISKVLKRNGVATLDMTGDGQVDRHLICQAFSLSNFATRVKLIDYRGFLTIALEGQGEYCDKLREYLLAMEKKARVDTVVYEKTGMIATDLLEVGEFADEPTIQSIMESQRNIQRILKLQVQQLKTEKRIDELEASTLTITDEQEHTFHQRKEKLLSLMTMNGKNSRQAYSWFWRTLKSRFRIGILHGMSREKFPFAIEWLDGLIAKEQAKSAQLHF